MSNNSTVCNIFATAEDLVNVLHDVESEWSLKYVQVGLFERAEQTVFGSFSSLPDLGIALAGDSNFEPTFLVLPSEVPLRVRAVPQRRGGVKYAVDQLENPGTIIIRPGGRYGESVVIAGMVGSVHDDRETENLLNDFSQALKKHFTRVKSYLVGPGARKLLDSGARLTKNVNLPKEFDLSV
jgi:hypothetical protein